MFLAVGGLVEAAGRLHLSHLIIFMTEQWHDRGSVHADPESYHRKSCILNFRPFILPSVRLFNASFAIFCSTAT